TPRSRKWLIRSMSTIAFVTTMPMSISRPIIDVRPSGVSVSSDRAIDPVAANGIETRRISGCSSDLKVATMMTNTMRIAASIARVDSDRVRQVHLVEGGLHIGRNRTEVIALRGHRHGRRSLRIRVADRRGGLDLLDIGDVIELDEPRFRGHCGCAGHGARVSG